MKIYVFENVDGGRLTPLAKSGAVDPLLKQAAETDNFEWMEPFMAAGDTELVYTNVFRQPQNPGGIVVVSAMDEVLFCAIANTNLDLVAAASHFASMVSNIRYGQDIFENIEGEVLSSGLNSLRTLLQASVPGENNEGNLRF